MQSNPGVSSWCCPGSAPPTYRAMSSGGGPRAGCCGCLDSGELAWLGDERLALEMIGFDASKLERSRRSRTRCRNFRKTSCSTLRGSGSTLIAFEKIGRQARLVELDPRYCDVIIQRWQDWAGAKAILEDDGGSFEEIAGSREAA